MKPILCLFLLFSPSALADEAADRASIERVIAALRVDATSSDWESRIAAVAESPKAVAELKRVGAVQFTFAIQSTGKPTVTISHEPWGEATFNLPMTVTPDLLAQIVVVEIRFVTADVALVEGGWEHDDAHLRRPVLFVMKRVGNDWKIASARELAPRRF